MTGLDLTETDHGFTYTPCDWCKEGKAVVVYKTWILLCNDCYTKQVDEDVYEQEQD